ncbi:MAG: hypothetical protein ACYC46_07585 [Acidobacteriaceae bacterium]
MADASIPSYSSGDLQVQFSDSLTVVLSFNLESATSDSATLLVNLKKNGINLLIKEDTIPTYGSLPIHFSGDGISLDVNITSSNFSNTTVYSCYGTCTASPTEVVTISGYLVGFTLSS